MGLFRKKKNTTTVKVDDFTIRFEKFGDNPTDFIIFAGMSDPEIAKEERLFVSWELLGSINKNEEAMRNFNKKLDEAADEYIRKIVREI